MRVIMRRGKMNSGYKIIRQSGGKYCILLIALVEWRSTGDRERVGGEEGLSAPSLMTGE